MIKFWNGNKSGARQNYEYQLLELLLEETHFAGQIDNDLTDYPRAEDEGEVLDKGADILVTVAGNRKFIDKSFIEIKHPLCFGLLGWRLAIVANHRLQEFQSISMQALKEKKVGVPATWVDAELFRANGFNVVERGSLDDMLEWVVDGSVDFITLGANEAHEILQQEPQRCVQLAIEPTLTIYYPFPLVFYINHQNMALANLISQQLAEKKTQIMELFDRHYGDVVDQAQLHQRIKLTLDNPMLPDGYQSRLREYEREIAETK